MIQFIQSLKIIPRWIIILIDLTLALMTCFFAYLLRLNFDIDAVLTTNYEWGILLYGSTTLFAIFVTQSYAGIIRYTGLQDGIRIFVSLSLGAFIAVFCNYVNFLLVGKNILPLSVLIIAYFLSIISLSSYRLLVKYIFLYFAGRVYSGSRNIINSIVYGVGPSSMVSKSLIEHDSIIKRKVIGFIEDDSTKIGKEINGAKIYDARKDLDYVHGRFHIDELIVSLASLGEQPKNRLVEWCLKRQVKVKNIPPMEKWINGQLSLSQIRNLRIEDLLGRDSIILDKTQVRNEMKDKVIMITGAAGSIGGGIVEQLLRCDPKLLVLLDQSESALYELCNALRRSQGHSKLQDVIADISNVKRLDSIFSKFRPDYVFHAAAYKHVPIMELNPSEAVNCNILGTKNVADLAVKYKVHKFVLISTDKAVNPTGVMGASKRIAEMYVQSLNNYIKANNPNSTSFITTRFGNVLGSNGSVIPLFKKQIEQGGPITITHPDITRYFMTIEEACQLVLEAATMGNGGEIYLFDMGKSVKIVDLAEKMIQLSGFEPHKDITIEFVGLREGEKLYEELLAQKENTLPTHHSKILIAKVEQVDYLQIKQKVEDLIGITHTVNELRLVGIMKEIVPEFKSNYSRFSVLDSKTASV